MNITETWLNKDITDIANIEGYNIYRGDRKEKEHGGTAIYLYNKLEADLICEISHKKCEMVAIKIPDIQTINIVVYRPPKTKLKEFDVLFDKLKDFFNDMKTPEPTIVLSGDFNFPFVKWSRLQSGG